MLFLHYSLAVLQDALAIVKVESLGLKLVNVIEGLDCQVFVPVHLPVTLFDVENVVQLDDISVQEPRHIFNILRVQLS